MARKDQLKICSVCGEVNPAEGLSCKACFADLTGGKQAGHAGQSQLAQLHRIVKRVETTNRRLGHLLLSFWLVVTLFVIWTVAAGVMGVGGPGQLFRWPF